MPSLRRVYRRLIQVPVAASWTWPMSLMSCSVRWMNVREGAAATAARAAPYVRAARMLERARATAMVWDC